MRDTEMSNQNSEISLRLPMQASPIMRPACGSSIEGADGVDASFPWGKILSTIVKHAPAVLGSVL